MISIIIVAALVTIHIANEVRWTTDSKGEATWRLFTDKRHLRQCGLIVNHLQCVEIITNSTSQLRL